MQQTNDAASRVARGETYRLLAACFCQPDLAVMREEQVFDQLAEALGSCCGRAVEDAKQLVADAQAVDPTELLVEYSRLFLGPNELLVPPYGSVYLASEAQVMCASTLRVVDAYQRAGLSLSAGQSELPDHIAIELEFLSFLSGRSAEVSGGGNSPAALDWDQLHDEFLCDHVANWIPRFAARVVSQSRVPFYLHLARCLETLVAQEAERAYSVRGGNPG